MNKNINMTLLSFLMIFLNVSCFEKSNKMETSETEITSKEEIKTENMRIKTAHGDIVIKLFSDVAPTTVGRIKELVNNGFYNGLTFHRVIENFVAQGGDPEGNGRGGSGQNLKAEFSDLKHKRGSVAMARSQDINSADSQFYIAYKELPHLDGKYTIFGEVIKGMENAEKIQVGDKMIIITIE